MGPRRGPPRLADLRRPLLPGRRVARRRLPRRHRGLLRPAHLRGHRRAARPAASTTSPSRSPARRPTDLTAKRNLTGVFQHWDCLDPDWNPGGIWRPVRVTETGPGPHRPPAGAVPRGHRRAGRARAARHARQRRRPHRVACTPRSAALDHVADQPLAAGANDVEWTVTVDRPGALVAARARRRRRCTTSTCGVVLDADEGGGAVRRPPPAHRACARCACAPGSPASTASGCSSRARTTGPTRMALAEATPDELAARRRRWPCDAGLDLLRIHAHITRPELYDAADEAGPAPVAGPPAAVGLRPRHPQAGRAPGRPRPSTCSATTRRSRSGAATTSRWRSRTTRRCGATRRRSGAWP